MFLLTVGTLASLFGGLMYPFMFFMYGELAGTFVDYDRLFKSSSSSISSSFLASSLSLFNLSETVLIDATSINSSSSTILSYAAAAAATASITTTSTTTTTNHSTLINMPNGARFISSTPSSNSSFLANGNTPNFLS